MIRLKVMKSALLSLTVWEKWNRPKIEKQPNTWENKQMSDYRSYLLNYSSFQNKDAEGENAQLEG